MSMRIGRISFALLFCAALGRAGDNPRSVRAIPVTIPPRVDGDLGDECWKSAEPASDFIQRDPEEGKEASERSEIRVVYDQDALYFGCMFYDSDPEKIVARLTRRDDEVESDWASIRIDSYHDQQTCVEFTFNPAGVKVDILEYDDANRDDDSWDPVWDLRTAITSRGWTAEIRIPFSVLRYRSSGDDTSTATWGINFLRHISRKQEDERWAFTPKSQSGFVSRFGHLTGLTNLPEPRRLEVLPFVTSKQSYSPPAALQANSRQFLGNAGVDLRYGLSSNFLIDATFNPDFGQVEADPAVLNLSTFETFYPEKRPFFIEGTQFIRFSTFGGDFGPGMFYSRRIGRAISDREIGVPDGGVIVDAPKATTILGAAKLSGKTNGGLSVGALEAVTQEENATVRDALGVESRQLLEPLAHYQVVRIRQDLAGNSNVGAIITSVAKESRTPAFTNGYDWNIKLDTNTYTIDGFVALSRSIDFSGERANGSAGKLNIGRIAGKHWLWSVSGDYTSNRYNIDDLGFFFSPDDWGNVGTLTYKEDAPASVVRNYSISATAHFRQNFESINLVREGRLGSGMLFSNYWSLSTGFDVDAGLYDQYETHGYGLYSKIPAYSASLNLSGDSRDAVVWRLGERFNWDNRFKRDEAIELGVNVRPASWMQWDVDAQVEKVRNQQAWFDTIEVSGEAKNIFGDRNTDQVNVTIRGTVTFTPDITLQMYSQVFLAKGHYENFRQLVGTSDFTTPDHYGRQPDFNRQEFNLNVVLRWEYFPGSTLFLVWSQARDDRQSDYFTSIGSDVHGTFQIPPSNVLLLKVSYWWSI